MRRLSLGIPIKNNNRRKVKLVRIVSSEVELTPDILPYTLGNLAKLRKEKYAMCTPADVKLIKQKIIQNEGIREEFIKGMKEGLSIKCIDLINKFDKTHPELTTLDDKINFLSTEITHLQNQVKDLQAFSTTGRKAYEESVLNDAEVVCTTLSTSGIELLNEHKFEYLIIDEACQVMHNLNNSAQNLVV